MHTLDYPEKFWIFSMLSWKTNKESTSKFLFKNRCSSLSQNNSTENLDPVSKFTEGTCLVHFWLLHRMRIMHLLQIYNIRILFCEKMFFHSLENLMDNLYKYHKTSVVFSTVTRKFSILNLSFPIFVFQFLRKGYPRSTGKSLI